MDAKGHIDGEATFDKSGSSVSMPDANIVAIGAPFNDSSETDAGHVRVYALDSTSNGIDAYTADPGNKMSVYPNPADGTYALDLESVYHDIVIIIRNGLGQEVNRQAFVNTGQIQVNNTGPGRCLFN